MAKIHPFRGVLYNREKISDPEAVMTPPYDVISPEAQERFYQRHPLSMIRLDLGKETSQDQPGDNRYTRAAETFQAWLSDGILQQDADPACYVYRIRYTVPGSSEKKEIRGFIAALELEEFGSGTVIPHEYTLSGPKTDRLNLLRACEANFSLIFSLLPPGGDSLVRPLAEEVRGMAPRFDVRDGEGAEHTLWAVTRPEILEKIRKGMEGKAVYIADGHHRYETSVNYRNERRAQAGTFTGEEGYNRVMMFFTEIEEGLTIFPTHRLVYNLSEGQLRNFFQQMWNDFEVTAYPFTEKNEIEVRERLLRDLREKGTSGPAFGLLAKGLPEYRLLVLKDKSLPDREGPEGYSSAWKRLDVSVLQVFVLEKLLGLRMEAMKKQENLHYVRGEVEAIREFKEGKYQLAFLLNPTRMEEIIEVAGAGDRMPQKSTYFYPKLLTGLVINKV